MTLYWLTADGLAPLFDAPGPDLALVADPAVLAHRIRLEGPPGRRRAEAAMLATDLVARPLDDCHLALGPVAADGSAWLAIADRAVMEFLSERLPADPPPLLPAALLLPAGPDPAAAVLGDWTLVRTTDTAAVLDPALAAASGVADPPPLSALLPPDPVAVAAAPNLLQGAFAPRARWWRHRRFRLGIAILALAALLFAIAPLLLERQRLAAAVATEDAATLAAAARALPGAAPADAQAAATALAAARARREAGLAGPRLAFAAATVAAVPGARLVSATLEGDQLLLELGGPAAAVNDSRARLLAGPFVATGAGTSVALGGRAPIILPGDPRLAAASARRLAAQRDALILAAEPAPAPVDAAAVAAALAAQAVDGVTAGGGRVTVPAVRATILLPLIAAQEERGLRWRHLAIRANTDATVAAELEPVP